MHVNNMKFKFNYRSVSLTSACIETMDQLCQFLVS